MATTKRGIQVRVVRTWEELQRDVFGTSFSPNRQRYRSADAFRGMCGRFNHAVRPSSPGMITRSVMFMLVQSEVRAPGRGAR